MYVGMKDEFLIILARWNRFILVVTTNINRRTVFIPINKVIPMKKRWDSSNDRASLSRRQCRRILKCSYSNDDDASYISIRRVRTRITENIVYAKSTRGMAVGAIP